MVRHEQVRTCRKRFIDDGADRIDGEVHASYVLIGITTDQADGVPRLGPGRVVGAFEDGDDVRESRHYCATVSRPLTCTGTRSSGSSTIAASRWRRIDSATAAPSPAADAACLVDPARTSPAANTPGMDVCNPLSVWMKPNSSSETLSFPSCLFGVSPMKTNAPSGSTSRSSPVRTSSSTTDRN